MTKQEQINELLKSNREVLLNGEKNNAICYDGFVNEEQYADVVVLLKETNGNGADGKMPEVLEDWDYYKWLKNQQVDNIPEERIDKKGNEYIEKNVFYASTFRKLCYWLSLLFDILENEEADPNKFMSDGKVNVEKVRKVLNRVAVMNLKKTFGGNQTDSKKLEEYVTIPEIRQVLREEMEILWPKVVLCCSSTVYWLATKIYESTVDFDYKKPSATIKGRDVEFISMNNTVYINFYHPQYYGKTDEEFSNYAIETFMCVKEYIDKNRCKNYNIIDIGLCGTQHVEND